MWNQRVIKNCKATLQLQIDKINAFQEEYNVSLDLCACKCQNFDSCDSLRAKKIPTIEREYLMDQRSGRRILFWRADPPTTAKKSQKERRRRDLPEAQLIDAALSPVE